MKNCAQNGSVENCHFDEWDYSRWMYTQSLSQRETKVAPVSARPSSNSVIASPKQQIWYLRADGQSLTISSMISSQVSSGILPLL
jgi:hypothetical protein